MRAPPLPHDEEARLAALRSYNVLDTQAERVFDAVVELAAHLCAAPIALIALVDRDRQWFKSAYGLSSGETDRSASLCAHVVARSELLEITDARADERFRDNPLVLSERIRFYAGAPLMTSAGHALGTVCVMDREPRALSQAQRAALLSLTEVVMNLLDARLEHARAQRFGSLVDQTSNEIYLLEPSSLRLVYANQGAQRNTLYSLAELTQLRLPQLQLRRQDDELRAALAELRGGARDSVVFESEFARKDGSRYPVEVRIQLQGGDSVPLLLAVVNDISTNVVARHAVAASHQRLREIADNIPALVSYVDNQQRYRFFNATYREWFGAEKKLSLGMTIRDMIGDKAYDHARPYIERCLRGERVTFETPVQFASQRRQAQVTYVPHWVDSAVDGFYILVSDVTAQKEAEDQLFQQKERLAVTLQSIGDGVVTTDVEGKVTYMNPLAEALTGWQNAEAAGRALSEVFPVFDAATKLRAPDPVLTALSSNSLANLTSNAVLQRQDGSELPIEQSAAPIHDRAGKTIGAVLVFRDMSATQAMALRMAHLAQHDALTHLPNRLLLNDRVTQAIAHAARNGNRVALMFLDLDRFKYVNDSLGHQVGDKLLRSVAQRLLGSVRATDTVCRQGGDEFVVLLSEIDDAAHAARVAEKLLKTAAAPHMIDANELHITLSIGISTYPDDAADAQAMAKNADTAMYHAKEQGRNNYQFFTAEMNARAHQRAQLEANLRRGLRRGEFALHYQPKMCLRTGDVVGAEALLRWQHPERGLVFPDQFIAVAEDAGMIVQLGQWVLRAVCQQLETWRSEGRAQLPIAINVSAAQVRDKGFVEDLRSTIAESGIDPSLIELELTESVLMQDAPSSTELLRTLKGMGLRLSIDDFGTGYSSLSYLKRFPIDALKIDRSFVRDINSDPDDAAIVSAIISLAKNLKQEVVAEGVETQAQLEFLRRHHCDQMQGYLFSKPVTARSLAEQYLQQR